MADKQYLANRLDSSDIRDIARRVASPSPQSGSQSEDEPKVEGAIQPPGAPSNPGSQLSTAGHAQVAGGD